MRFVGHALIAGLVKILAGIALLFVLINHYDGDTDEPVPEPSETPAPQSPAQE